jgi:hypothetical protein
VAPCSGGRIVNTDGTVADCTNDDTDDCAGVNERHEGDPVARWRLFGEATDRRGIHVYARQQPW